MSISSLKYSQELYSKLTSLSLLTRLNIYCVSATNMDLFKIEFLEKPKILPRLDHPTLRKENQNLDIKENEVIIYSDEVSLNYLAMKNPEQSKDSLIILGPFFYTFPTEQFIDDYIIRKNIPMKEKHILINYFKSVKILTSAYIRALARVTSNLIKNPYEDSKLRYIKTETTIPLDYIDYEELENASNAVDLRYSLQNELLYYVEQGDKEKAIDVMSQIVIDAEGRAKTPLRSLKNLAFSLNTMFRIAAERGGVSPYQLHTESNKYAIIIEDINNIQSITQIQNDMIASYCKLVNRANTKGLSKPIIDAVHYIENHLDRKISLIDISQHANINDSHLSRQFKKETGKTVTEYINEKKIRRAKYYLENTNNSITDISVMCGFENHNYFSKIFKEKTGCTPREYQKNIPLKDNRF